MSTEGAYRVIHWREQARAESAVPTRKDAAAIARRANGLADPNRIALALILRAAGQASITDLAELTGIERSVVSRHLLKLKSAGLTKSTRHGRLAVHWLTPDGSALLAVLAPDG